MKIENKKMKIEKNKIEIKGNNDELIHDVKKPKKHHLQEVRKYGKIKSRVYNGVVYIEQNRDDKLVNMITAVYEALTLSNGHQKLSATLAQEVLKSMVNADAILRGAYSVDNFYYGDKHHTAETVIGSGLLKDLGYSDADAFSKTIRIKHSYKIVKKPVYTPGIGIEKQILTLKDAITKPFKMKRSDEVMLRNNQKVKRYVFEFQSNYKDKIDKVEYYPEVKKVVINGCSVKDKKTREAIIKNIRK